MPSKMDKHPVYKAYKGLHNTAGDREGGKCMVRCEYIYKESNSCSYRWQSLKWIDAGGADRHIYESHPNGLTGSKNSGWSSVSPAYGQQLSAAGALVSMATAALTKA